METFVLILALCALGAFVNVKAYYMIKSGVFRTAWISPLFFAVANLYLFIET